jgi:hypothetical protein
MVYRVRLDPYRDAARYHEVREGQCVRCRGGKFDGKWIQYVKVYDAFAVDFVLLPWWESMLLTAQGLVMVYASAYPVRSTGPR